MQAHRWRARLGLRCLTVRVSDRIVRHLISTGYLSLESRETAAAVAIALEAWISDNVIDMAQKLSHQLRAAEDRIAELEAEVAAHQERAERAEQWLH